jgi:hypothetical protein
MSVAEPREPPTRRRGWARLLLLIPFAAVLWVPFYNRDQPVVFGFPFFYFYQLVWILLSTVVIGIVYRAEH